MGKNVIITGASSGIGAALAYQYAKEKYNVILAARNIVKIEEIASQISKKHNVQTLAVQCDVSIEQDCNELINKTIAKFGHIDILINNAGISMRALFEEVELNVIRRLMDVNFMGAVYCTKYALPYIKQTKGSIVAVSSIAGYRGLPGRTGYSASKFAMQGFFESLRTELIKDGVQVHIACPGYTDSNVRLNALTAKGNAQGATPYDESNLMKSEDVALIIYNAVNDKKAESIMTFKGKLTVFLSRILSKKTMDKIVLRAVMKDDAALMKK